MTAADPWPAPQAPGPLDAVVTLPGSKSVTNRALVLAALTPGRSVLRRPLRSRDTELMAAALRVLGAAVEDAVLDGDDAWVVTGSGGPAPHRGTSVDVGNAGTVARFLPPVAALGVGDVRFDGDPRVRDRPLGPLLRALADLGGRLDRLDRLPVVVSGRGGVPGGTVVLDASQSSQLVSGLLLSAPRFDEGLHVRHDGPPLPSAPHLAMTVEALRACGAVVEDDEPGTWAVAPGSLRPRDVVVEPDLSTAAAYLAAPLVAGGAVTVAGWPATTTQPGALLPEVLAAMGAHVERADDRVTVRAGERLTGVDVDLRDAGELTPVLTALAALADGPSRFRGVAHLRLQETDRLAALATELGGLGGDVRETDDGLEVRPKPLTGGALDSYDDHRIAMAWAVLGLGVAGVLVRDVATTRKTVPDFVGSWTALLGAGPRG
ncbi:MAG TPA: 3-phosphoshikimate 1-carboxyvinyltransferase [Mycobacteriales bacterium]|nr:3-phosphoshikimate 1-carboxyvinyltransferase [Mycobacteriales bacterium]